MVHHFPPPVQSTVAVWYIRLGMPNMRGASAPTCARRQPKPRAGPMGEHATPGERGGGPAPRCQTTKMQGNFHGKLGVHEMQFRFRLGV